ncbi:His-Xaa-Ser system radical SAM maturase HxsB [Myroides sp. TSA_177.3]|uniref:His-Xaa-Ser system radical SAM maturase HxsB n=1 Tax=Myroides sp. TSA_177.3 TaxID=3415650 RepID=UPI004045AAF0
MIDIKSKQETRKFKNPDYYNTSETYYLLPFKFKSLNNFVDIITNDIGDFVLVPKNFISELVTKRFQKNSNIDLYYNLISNFIISETPVPELLEVLVARYRTKKSFLDHFTALHIFVISLRCEHTCHYCQVSRVVQDKKRYDMSFYHIDEGIKLMMQSPNPNLTMEFQGGEALLAFDKIVYAVEKAKIEADKKSKNISFVICTNLALINDDILAFVKEHNILISTSLDGPEILHNKNRKRPGNNSYELTINGIDKCRKILGNDKVSALMTTSNLSLQYPKEIVDEYVNLGFSNIFLRPISPYGFAKYNPNKNHYFIEEFLAFYKEGLLHILEYNKKGIFIAEDYASILLKKIFTPFPVGYVDLQSPSGILNSVIVFNYDGKVYASDEARMIAESKDFMFQLGELGKDNYEDIFYGSKALEISESWCNEGLAGCSDCAFQPYCGADPILNYATQGDLYGFRPTSIFCKKNMEIIRFIFELIATDKENEIIFKSWITGFQS